MVCPEATGSGKIKLVKMIPFLFLVIVNCADSTVIISKTVTVDGLSRGYSIQIPSSYDGKNGLPIVFVLHGGGGSGKNMMNFTGFGKLGEKENFFVVYPDGHNRQWNDAKRFF